MQYNNNNIGLSLYALSEIMDLKKFYYLLYRLGRYTFTRVIKYTITLSFLY